MLHIVAWLGIYSAVLLCIGKLIGPWRDRRWFKVLFLPGTFLTVVVHTAASWLCIGGKIRSEPLRDACPVISVDRDKVPYFAGALFLLVSHALFYTVFVVAVYNLQTAGLVRADLVKLPSVYPYEWLEGRIELDLRHYLGGLRSWLSEIRARPLGYLLLLYILAPVFANFRLRGKEFLWAGVVVIALGLVVYFAEWMGMGFPVMSRGWWAQFFYFPAWWGVFSFYFTHALAALVIFALVQLSVGIKSRVLGSAQSSKGGAKKKTPA